MVEHIKLSIAYHQKEDILNNTWWIVENNGKFSVRSAWEYSRHREKKEHIFNYIFPRKIPFKLFFLMWRA